MIIIFVFFSMSRAVCLDPQVMALKVKEKEKEKEKERTVNLSIGDKE